MVKWHDPTKDWDEWMQSVSSFYIFAGPHSLAVQANLRGRDRSAHSGARSDHRIGASSLSLQALVVAMIAQTSAPTSLAPVGFSPPVHRLLTAALDHLTAVHFLALIAGFGRAACPQMSMTELHHCQAKPRLEVGRSAYPPSSRDLNYWPPC